ncbi:hypothetical protein BU24DRAFT_488852 [Aaosphaeria arxii CBS 175.79]|uniref:Xylanolytic transcriptional activator regulatory domain-containing protein n=1 Tax=Aaosphaeria arxii CBS 175.79 TaxID=1450172 RepID=A0A6A5Y1I8_9PLEO|nr:uncharacterized protein BU24DRAFT_488852 [Aaosphaeria arxii CBS 175.79]KAF2018781.1 hypothetical protein BU24DRAFT_488852 [Aaosphaeria arxii CBS 175.79]
MEPENELASHVFLVDLVRHGISVMNPSSLRIIIPGVDDAPSCNQSNSVQEEGVLASSCDEHTAQQRARSPAVLQLDGSSPSTSQNTALLDDCEAANIEESCEERPAPFARFPIGISNNAFTIYSYYPFIHCGSIHKLHPDDVCYLDQRGCFRVPSQAILDEFVQEYFLHVHPVLPILDEGEFWKSYNQTSESSSNESNNRIPLFLFQAILFAGCSFLPLPMVQSMGFESIQAARAAFYSRAKALFDLDTCRDAISSSHCALLLTYYTSAADATVNSYWVNVAVHYARQAGAHSDIHESDVSPARRNILKRLWWGCICRDRTISLGLRRPLQIIIDSSKTQYPMLTEDDFEIRVFIAQCELLLLLSDILDISSARKTTVPPLDANHKIQKLRESMSNLDSWYKQMHNTFLYAYMIPDRRKSLTLYISIIHIYYYSAKIAACNCALSLSMASSSQEETGYDVGGDSTESELESALHGNTEALESVLQMGLAKYLPVTITALIALPLAWSYRRLFAVPRPFRDERRKQDLKLYIAVMNELRVRYQGAEELLEYIRTAINYENDPRRLHGSGDFMAHMDEEITTQQAAEIAGSKAIEIARHHSRKDVRLAVIVNICLAKGTFPQEADMPGSLQLIHSSVHMNLNKSQGTNQKLNKMGETQRRITQKSEASAEMEANDSHRNEEDPLLPRFRKYGSTFEETPSAGTWDLRPFPFPVSSASFSSHEEIDSGFDFNSSAADFLPYMDLLQEFVAP